MNTITIDSNTYNNIEQYARQNHMSVTEAVVTGLNTFLGKFIKAKVSALTMVTANFICVERCKMPLETYRRKVDFLRDFLEK